MYCPRPASTTKTQNTATPGTKTVNPPAPRTEGCNASSSTVITDPTSGGSTSTTVNVPGPAGPAGANGKDGLSFFWRGDWGTGASYETATLSDPTDRVYDVVYQNGSSYICILDHTADDSNKPQPDGFVGPTDWTTYWHLVAKQGSGAALSAPDKDFFDQLKDNIFDWVKHASIGDLLLAGLGVAGVLWAGSKIVSALTGDGKGDGNADSRFKGTPGYVTTAFVPPTLQVVLSSLCEIEDVAFDVSALSPTDVCTFTVGQVTSIRTIIDQLSLAYQFEMVDTGGILKFVPRSASPVVSIPIVDMGIAQEGNAVPAVPIQSKRYQGIDLPKQVNLQYYAEDIDYNVMTQTAELQTYNLGQIINLQVPVTLSHEKAKQICEVSLVNAWLESKQCYWTTTYKYIHLEPGDVVDLEPVGLTRITKLSESSEGILAFEGTDAGASEAMEASNLVPMQPPVSTNIPTVVGYSQALYIDPPNLDDTDKDVRIKVAVHGYDVAGWPGADIYCSIDGGATSFIAASALQEATIGLVAAVTATHDYHMIDNDTTISVQLKTNSLTSTDEISMFNGKNMCMVGQEMISFKTATLTAPGVYSLTGLLRGRQGTEQYISTHQANELFVLLDETIVTIPWTTADRFTTKKYKVVTRGSSPDKVDWEDVFMISNNTLMWTVLNPKAVFTGTDITFTWNQRVRFDNSIKDLATTNNDSDYGGYGVVIYAADGVTIKRTSTSTNESFVYTTAMQITDFGVAQTHVKAAIAQISTIYGSGYPVIVTL